MPTSQSALESSEHSYTAQADASQFYLLTNKTNFACLCYRLSIPFGKRKKMNYCANLLVYTFLLCGIRGYLEAAGEPIIGGPGCESLFKCLGSVHRLAPFRWNINPITIYDRLKSHHNGNDGWTPSELRNFEKNTKAVERLKMEKESKKRIHSAKVKLYQDRIRRIRYNLVAFKINKSPQEGLNLDEFEIH